MCKEREGVKSFLMKSMNTARSAGLLNADGSIGNDDAALSTDTNPVVVTQSCDMRHETRCFECCVACNAGGDGCW